ncbi:MAG: outer membrane lipoprotein-sorting protein [Acidobacteriota bacterium]
MTRFAFSLLLVLAILWAPGAAAADEATPSLAEIVEKTNHVAYYQGQDGRAVASLTITDGKGRVRRKDFTILRRDQGSEDGAQKLYVYFDQPADERGVTFLVWKHLGKDDDRWLYLPALDVQKRIAASDERTSFVGSHFFYEDVSGRGIDEDHHRLIETTANYYVLENTPKDPKAVEFDRFTMWIHKASFIPVEIKFEQDGNVYRTLKVLAVEDIQGKKTVTKMKMSDQRIGGHTVLEYSQVDYDLGLPEEIFSERYLRNPPRQHLP